MQNERPLRVSYQQKETSAEERGHSLSFSPFNCESPPLDSGPPRYGTVIALYVKTFLRHHSSFEWAFFTKEARRQVGPMYNLE